MLAWVISRTRRARTLDAVVVATSVLPEDDLIVTECEKCGVPSFRGSENDVLDRYYEAASAFEADPVVRITSDCPLIDPDVIDTVVSDFGIYQPDYASNTLVRRLPRGLDVEVFSKAALAEAWLHEKSAPGRTHVTPHLYLNPGKFKLHSVDFVDDYSHLRWTVDTIEDLEVIRGIVTALSGRDDFGWRDGLTVVEQNPRLATANQDVLQKTLEEG
jgi:spore coat polysaccharide biosynthesis protein SpsF